MDNKETVRLNISMAYTFVGDTGIDVPAELLEGKSEDEKLQIAYEYAMEHIDEIPVADNAEYVVTNSDSFELEDCYLQHIITKEMIKSGIKTGLITFVPDPNADRGTVCKIGDGRFCFGGTEGKRYSPEEYIKNIPEDDIIDEIFETLEDFRKAGIEDFDSWSEYDYYWHILMYRINFRWSDSLVPDEKELKTSICSFVLHKDRELKSGMVKYALWIKSFPDFFGKTKCSPAVKHFTAKTIDEIQKQAEKFLIENFLNYFMEER